MKQLANKIARAILQAIVNDLPIPQREYGRAMLAEIDQIDGLQALEWASGGIQLWIETRGKDTMKNTAFWIGLVAIGILAGGLYVARGFGLIWAAPVAAIAVIALSAFRPRDAMPVALFLGASLPVAELFRVWIVMRMFILDIEIPRSIDADFPTVTMMNALPQLTVAVLLGAIVIAGISAFIRSRVAARA
jgi:hypothetical protein